MRIEPQNYEPGLFFYSYFFYKNKKIFMDLTDNSSMPFGLHKGKTLKEVPDLYLLWLWEANEGKDRSAGRATQDVLFYIRENLDAIRENLKKI